MPKNKKKRKKIIIKKNKGGRPTKYRKKFIEQAYIACADLGARTKDLCKLFNIDRSNLRAWMRKYPEFRSSIISGKDIWDNDLAEKALKSRICGFTFDEVKIEEVSLKGRRKNNGVFVSVPGIKRTVTKKYYPPEPKCLWFWLQNRQPGRWRNAKYIEKNISTSKTEKEEWLEVLRNIPEKQLRKIQKDIKAVIPDRKKLKRAIDF